MKKLTKIGLIAALVFFAMGLGCVIAAAALGATWVQFKDAVDGWESYFPRYSFSESSGGGSEKIQGDNSSQYFSDVEDLAVDFGRGELEIRETDEERISVDILSDPSHSIQAGMEKGTLKISEKSDVKENAKLRINLPEDEYFEKADMDLGAASVTVDYLDADKLKVKLGAGSFHGNGEILSEKSVWEVGMGELELSYLECEDVEMTCGMGSITACLGDSQEDYTCDADCGIGSITIGDNDFVMGSHTMEGDDAFGKIQVECGVGTVKLSFEDD